MHGNDGPGDSRIGRDRQSLRAIQSNALQIDVLRGKRGTRQVDAPGDHLAWASGPRSQPYVRRISRGGILPFHLSAAYRDLGSLRVDRADPHVEARRRIT